MGIKAINGKCLSHCSQFLEDVGDRRPAGRLFHDGIQPGFGCFEAGVYPHLVKGGEGHLGHLGIELPGMEVEHRGSALGRGLSQSFLHQPERQQSEIPASGHRQFAATGQRPSQRRDLQQPGGVRITTDHERSIRCRRYAVPGVADRENRGVVSKTGFDQYIDSPRGLRDHTKRRGTISQYRLAGLVFEEVFAFKKVLAEAIGVETVEAVVSRSVAGDFVTGIGDTTGQLRVATCHMPQDKKSPPLVVSVKQREQQVGVALHARGPVAPIAFIDRAVSGLDMKILFHIDTHAAQSGRAVASDGADWRLGLPHSYNVYESRIKLRLNPRGWKRKHRRFETDPAVHACAMGTTLLGDHEEMEQAS